MHELHPPINIHCRLTTRVLPEICGSDHVARTSHGQSGKNDPGAKKSLSSNTAKSGVFSRMKSLSWGLTMDLQNTLSPTTSKYKMRYDEMHQFVCFGFQNVLLRIYKKECRVRVPKFGWIRPLEVFAFRLCHQTYHVISLPHQPSRTLRGIELHLSLLPSGSHGLNALQKIQVDRISSQSSSVMLNSAASSKITQHHPQTPPL